MRRSRDGYTHFANHFYLTRPKRFDATPMVALTSRGRYG
jgi:hypothetical protein